MKTEVIKETTPVLLGCDLVLELLSSSGMKDRNSA